MAGQSSRWIAQSTMSQDCSYAHMLVVARIWLMFSEPNIDQLTIVVVGGGGRGFIVVVVVIGGGGGGACCY